MAEKEKAAAKQPAAEERLFTIPLRREWLKTTMNRRARRSIATIRGHLSRHMKVPEKDIRVSVKLNDSIWVRGAGKPPAKIRLKASLDASTGLLHARLPNEEAPRPEKKPAKGEKPADKEKAMAAVKEAAEKAMSDEGVKKAAEEVKAEQPSTKESKEPEKKEQRAEKPPEPASGKKKPPKP
jgi:ribosomal protein L31E